MKKVTVVLRGVPAAGKSETTKELRSIAPDWYTMDVDIVARVEFEDTVWERSFNFGLLQATRLAEHHSKAIIAGSFNNCQIEMLRRITEADGRLFEVIKLWPTKDVLEKRLASRVLAGHWPDDPQKIQDILEENDRLRPGESLIVVGPYDDYDSVPASAKRQTVALRVKRELDFISDVVARMSLVP